MDETYDPEKRWWTLSVLCLSLVIVVVGNTVLNVALPTLVRDLGATASELQWIVDAYALVFAGLLFTAGALGDRFGRKAALNVGLVIFGTASGIAAFSNSPTVLIVWRAVMGIGAALIMPATLAILTNIFPPRERAKAIAIWAGLAGAGAAIGPVTSGFLLEHFWWGSVFLVNVFLVAVAIVVGRRLVPDSRDPAQAPLDPVGALLSITGLAALLYAIIEAPAHGWTGPETLLFGGAGLAVLAAFGLWELRSDHPMLDLRMFRNPTFSSASGAISLIFFAMFGQFFLLTQYLQLVLGYGALEAGVRTLPMAFAMMFAAPNSARLVERFGPRATVSTGLAVAGAGIFMLAQCDPSTPYWYIVVSLVVIALGMGSSMAPSTTAIMASMPLGKAGVGSAVNDTTRELGGALGVAVLGSLMASRYVHGLPDLSSLGPQSEALARSSIGGAVGVAQQLPPVAADALLEVARTAYSDGMGLALTAASAVVLFAALMVRRHYPAAAVMPAYGGGHAPAPAFVPEGAAPSNGHGHGAELDPEPAVYLLGDENP